MTPTTDQQHRLAYLMELRVFQRGLENTEHLLKDVTSRENWATDDTKMSDRLAVLLGEMTKIVAGELAKLEGAQ